MTAKTATEAMRRKAGAGRPAPEIGRMTAPRAWQIAMPRAAEDVLGVQVSILKVDESRLVRDALQGLVSEHALLALLEGPEGRFGLAILDASVLAGLVEAATTGRIAPRPVVPRKPTRTDAMISADILDALLDGFESSLVEMDDPPNLAGYRYAAPVVDARAISMTLADGPYSVFRLAVDLGGGVRQGEIMAAFPVAPQGAARRQDVAVFQQALADNVMGAPAELDAALCRLRMPLSAVTELQPGDILRVPLAALAAVEVESVGGPSVARARLGQQGGFRAVRITQIAGELLDFDGDAPEFQEAAPAASRAALPPVDQRIGNVGEADQSDFDSGFPQMDDLPPLDGGDADLPDLPPPEDDGPLPDLPGLPPLSG